jgi:hypothetical protein
MLDLSAAFNVIDHPILMERLQYSYGITGQALTWINSYLSDADTTVDKILRALLCCKNYQFSFVLIKLKHV